MRAIADLVRCIFYMWRFRYNTLKDDRPILVVPGFMASDVSTAVLRRFLKKNGYCHAYPWKLGRNFGDMSLIPALSNQLEQLYAQHQQKVTLIGWSLGGVLAREIAKQKPDMVAQLITLGSPFADLEAPNYARWVFDLLHDENDVDKDWLAKVPIPAPIPTTALFSKKDGILPWQACMEPKEDDLHQNIEVESSHFGFGANPQVFDIVLARLRGYSPNFRLPLSAATHL